MSPRVVYSRHAQDMLTERNIEADWVVRTIVAPDSIEDDPSKPGRMRAFRKIAENDNRVLRVVYVRTESEIRIVTVFFDRGRSKQSG